ncbi:MAG: DUF1656 domain-containing protein [Reyranella sp.]|nr:DUF1656 domain-containing protein [Reyranella sp.]
MAFTEVDLFGVYVAPISLMMLAAWLVTAALRSTLGHFGLLRFIWHPALFLFSVYIIVLACITLVKAR